MNRILSVASVIILVTAFAACGKKKADTAQFEPVCQKILKCSKAGESNPAFAHLLQPDNCTKFFAKMSAKKQMAAALPKLVACVNDTKCEELNMNTCFAQAMQGMQVPMMGQ